MASLSQGGRRGSSSNPRISQRPSANWCAANSGNSMPRQYSGCRLAQHPHNLVIVTDRHQLAIATHRFASQTQGDLDMRGITKAVRNIRQLCLAELARNE